MPLGGSRSATSNDSLHCRPPRASIRGHLPTSTHRRSGARHRLILLALLLLGGAACDRSEGRFAGKVDVGGHSLFLYCTGEGSPTLVMDIAAGAPSRGWLEAMPPLQATTRTCVYDRAGLGGSDDGPTPTTSRQMVDELHRLLSRAGVEPPFILLGWSFGGLNMRLYSASYPEDVVALALVEASHPEQFERFQAVLPPPAPGQPPGFQFFREKTFGNPDVDLEESMAQAAEVTNLGDLPLAVVVRGQDASENFGFGGIDEETAQRLEAAWQEMQRELLGLSEDSVLVRAEKSGHCIHCTEPDLLREVVLGLIEKVREGGGSHDA